MKARYLLLAPSLALASLLPSAQAQQSLIGDYVVTIRVTVARPADPTPPGPPAPAPTPRPEPRPDPAPIPVVVPYAGPLQVALIYDMDHADSTVPLRVSTLKKDLAALGCTWLVRDYRTAEAKSWLATLDARGLVDASGTITAPAVIFVTPDSALKGLVESPSSPEQVVAKVKQIRGGQ